MNGRYAADELHLVFTHHGLALHSGHALPLTFMGVRRVILHTRSGPHVVTADDLHAPELSELMGREGRLNAFHPMSAGASTADYAAFVLGNRGAPLRFAQLLQAIQDETAAGPVKPQTLHSALARDGRFILLERGLWGLTRPADHQEVAWPDDEVPVGPGDAVLKYGTVLILHTMMRGYPALQRTLRVPGRATLFALHRALQLSYGWQDQHLNLFSIAGQDYEARTSDPSLGEGHLDAALYTVEATLPLGMCATYLYDWSARWRVDMHVTEVHLSASADEPFACLEGSRACIPESIFGEATYLSYCSALRDQPRSALARRATAALGADHDPEHFDLAALNMALDQIPNGAGAP